MAKQTFSVGQTLTAAQMTSLQQTAMLGGAASAKTASYTLVAADAGTAISMTSASATTITVNTALFAAGDTVQITNLGAGICTITAGTATVNTSASLALAQYESGTLDFDSTSSAIFIKGAGAAAASGGMTSLASGSVGSSGIDLTSISSSYEILILKIIDIDMGATNGVIGFRFNNDSAGNYYAINTIASNGTVVTEAKNAQTITQINYGDYSTTANGAIVILTLPNYKDTTGFKLFDIIAGATTTIPTQDSAQSVGHWKNESAINRIYFGGVGAQTFDAGATYQLFGVK